MLKLAIFAVMLACAAAAPGQFVPATQTDKVTEIARWCAASLSTSTAELHSVVVIKNLQVQVVNGMNYKFDLEMLVQRNGQYVNKRCSMSVYDQAWTNTRSFNEEPQCAESQSRAMSVGGFVEQPVVTAEALELAQWCAAAMSTAEVHAVVAIKNLRTQVVNGVNYLFDLELTVNGVTKKTCAMSVYEQKWTNTRLFNEEPKCQVQTATGSFVTSEVSDKVKEIASWAAQTMSSSVTHSVLTIKDVQTQLVNGVNYKFTLELLAGEQSKSCKMSVYVSFANEKKFNAEPVCEYMSRAGGLVEQSVVSDKVKEIASWASLAMSNGNQHEIVSISNVRTQVVNGMNYHFTLSLIVDKKISKVCEVAIYDQVWTRTRKFISTPECTEEVANVNAGPLAGGFVSQSVVSAEALEVAKWSASMLSLSAGQEHRVVTVKNLRTQVVAGVNYRFTLEMSVSHAPAMVITTKSCEMDVFTQAWTSTRKFNSEPVCH